MENITTCHLIYRRKIHLKKNMNTYYYVFFGSWIHRKVGTRKSMNNEWWIKRTRAHISGKFSDFCTGPKINCRTIFGLVFDDFSFFLNFIFSSEDLQFLFWFYSLYFLIVKSDLQKTAFPNSHYWHHNVNLKIGSIRWIFIMRLFGVKQKKCTTRYVNYTRYGFGLIHNFLFFYNISIS